MKFEELYNIKNCPICDNTLLQGYSGTAKKLYCPNTQHYNTDGNAIVWIFINNSWLSIVNINNNDEIILHSRPTSTDLPFNLLTKSKDMKSFINKIKSLMMFS